MRQLKHRLTVADGEALWAAPRDGWQIQTRHTFSQNIIAEEYHDATTNPLARLGRATCRVCGGVIEKGAPRFMVVGDPRDNGWTAEYWYVHATRCVGVSRGETT